MEACSLLVNLRKGMQSSSEQPLVGEEHCVTILITAAKETRMEGKHSQGNCVREEELRSTQSEIAILLPSSQESGLLCV